MGKHVDEWIESIGADDYAAWVINHFRLPAILGHKFDKFMREHKLFCTYKGGRYRVTGASRMGDIYLAVDKNQPFGYDIRVYPDECVDWSNSY